MYVKYYRFHKYILLYTLVNHILSQMLWFSLYLGSDELFIYRMKYPVHKKTKNHRNIDINRSFHTFKLTLRATAQNF